MLTLCTAYDTEEEARASVDELLAGGVPDAEVRVVSGAPARDLRGAPAGSFAGRAGAERLGSFAGTVSAHDPMGGFGGETDGRRGDFGALDRETVTTYHDGVRRVQIVSHPALKRMLVEAGLDDAAAEADVEALHRGRVLVLRRAAA